MDQIYTTTQRMNSNLLLNSNLLSRELSRKLYENSNKIIKLKDAQPLAFAVEVYSAF